MFKISNSSPSDAQGQAPADLPVHTMKKDLEEIEHPSSIKSAYQDTSSQNNPVLNATQKSSPFLNSVPQPKQFFTSIKFKDEASEQRIEADKMARQKAEEKRLTEQKKAEAEKLAKQQAEEQRLAIQKAEEERRNKERKEAEQKLAEQKALEEKRILEQRAEEKRLAEQKIAEEKLAKQKAEMAQKMAEENAKREKQVAEQKAEAERLATKREAEQKLAEQKALEEKRTLEKRAEEKRLAEQKIIEKKLATEKMIAEQKAEKDKKLAEKNAKKLANAGKGINSKNIVYLVFSIALILLIAGGVYYFWVTRQQKEPTVIVPDQVFEPIPDPTTEPEPTPSITFSTDKPNYLIIDQANPTAGEIKIALKKYIDDVFQSGITTPVEFVITDEQNNLFAFSNFASNLGITLSPDVMSNLEDTFSLFIYNDQNAMRLGLAIDSKNDPVLKIAMLKEGKSIITETLPLFMDNSFESPAKTGFIQYFYYDTELYYINLLPQGLLASNYGTVGNKLLIGTSKKTIFSMVDYIKNSEAGTEQ